jgi:peptide/nickel transport system substrate-binding protein
MQRRTSRALAATAAALTAVSLSACATSERDSGSSGGTGAKQQSGGTMVFGAAGDPAVLDPAFASDGESFRPARQIFDGLLTNKPGTTELAPSLAEDWKISEDGLTYTFTLRKGVKFQDGTEFNADAVCFNFDRWYNFKGLAQSPSASYYYQAVFGGFADSKNKGIYDSCEATDASTAVVKLSQVTSKLPAALSLPAFSMQSPDALKKYDADNLSGSDDALTYSEYGLSHPTGTGPFKFDSWDRGNGEVTLVRNDDYWGDKALLDKIVFRTIPEGNTRRQALEAGEIDGYDFVDPADYDKLSSSGAQVLVRDPFNILYLGFNGGNVPGTKANKALQKPEVRQALAYAVDRETIVNSLLPEGAEVAKEFMPPTVDGWADDVTQYDYDPAKAKELLKQAGEENLTLSFYYPTDVSRPYMPDPAALYQVISKNLEDVGITVKPTALQWNPDYLQAVQAGQGDLHLLGWTGDYNDAYNFIGTFFAEDQNNQASAEFGAFSAPDIFKALADADKEPDQAKRTELYQEANRLIMDYLPGLPLSHSPPALAVSDKVSGLVPSPLTAEEFSTVSISK